MIYISETDLAENKSIYFSLTKIFGINKFNSFLICKKIGLTPSLKVHQLTSDQILKLIKCIEKSNLKKSKIMLAKKLIQIKAYKGIRRLRGYPIRGQRTHTNAKTAAKLR